MKQLTGTMQPWNEDDWEAFSSIWEPVSAKRNEQLTRPGEKERYLYFVAEGVQRVYYLDERGREATIVFTYAPSFGGVLDAFLLQQPSRYFYETLTPSEFIRAPHISVQRLMTERPGIQTLVLKGIAASLSGVLERLVSLQIRSSEEKFRELLQRSPHILQLVPHKHLASYLGMDPTNFSKLMNKVRI